ncbi:MAG: hypothetical protein KC493_15110 [Bacteriovoracaceae bacterium]|nr:hypothetical protein [Bacteriovoracaceae bacterium]
MLFSFLRYFTHYLFHAKTRQKLLFLAVFGLFLSSFSLIVLQSTMGGLQNNLMGRSKKFQGHSVINLIDSSKSEVMPLLMNLKSKEIPFHLEYTLELLLRQGNFISPIEVHGLSKDFPPPYLPKYDYKEGVSGADLANKMNMGLGSQVQMISPAHTNSFLGDIPRSISIYVDNVIRTDVPEVDLYHFWTTDSKLQNLTRDKIYNRVVIHGPLENSLINESIQKYPIIKNWRTWESLNETLVWALRLETTIMVFLFVAMTMLVSLCITSGLLIFFDKIKVDLASFWILGSSKKKLNNSSSLLLHLMSLFSVLGGLVFGLFFLYLLDKYGVEVLPDVFVDRKIPIFITLKGVLVSFVVPYSISLIFSTFSLGQFKKENNFLDHVRTIG